MLSWGLKLFLVLALLFAGIIAYYAKDLPDIEEMEHIDRRRSVVMLSTEGEIFATYGDNYGKGLTLKEISPFIVQAVISTEDRRFYSHFGLDVRGLARAMLTNLRAGRMVEGGSTITQQLAKNLFLKPDRTLRRKIQELLLALRLEQRFTKDQLLTIYLNRVYLGSGTFGVDAAARRYFDVSARDVTLYQGAVLAGLLKAPSRYSPLNDPQASHDRTVQVLNNMVENGVTDRSTVDKTIKAKASRIVSLPPPAGRYYSDWVLTQLDALIETAGEDVVVQTTLNLSLQRKTEAELKALLDGPGAKAKVSQGAVVVLSPNGAVRALSGGRDYDKSQFNRAVQSQRQPGSAFKPFLYLAALEEGFTPDSLFDDTPIRRGKWRPKNYNGKFEGSVSLRHAFAHSTNTVAVRLIERITPKRVAEEAHQLGITSDLGLEASLALGTSEVNLLELTSAIASFSNHGNGVAAYGIEKVSTPEGRVLWSHRPSALGPVMSPSALAGMHEIMSAVITEGSGKAAQLDRPAAGKTGTTQDYRDAWFVGFTADYAAGVWLGNDDQRQEMKGVTGGGLPAQMWKKVMMAAHQKLPVRPLPTPRVEAPTALVPTLPSENAQEQEKGVLDGLIESVFGN